MSNKSIAEEHQMALSIRASLFVVLGCLSLVSETGRAQDLPVPAPPSAATPQHIPAPHGEVVLASPFDRQIYDEDHLAAARRVGDWIFLSGVAIGARQPIDAAGFESRLQRLFTLIGAKLCASGAGFEDVVAMRSYHAWRNPEFTGTKDEHNAVFARVRDRFIKPPYPVWTAIGVDQLFDDNGLVEVELTAYAPLHSGQPHPPRSCTASTTSSTGA
jgi:enamine deaminase RidA (YjgF/YER057c/UK114 family)